MSPGLLFIEMLKLKRKTLSIEEKAAICTRLESGEANVKIASEFQISHSTVSTVWKNREKIKQAFNDNVLKAKRLRISQHEDIETALLQWFKYQRNQGVPINGPILQEKANDYAKLFGKPDFKCTESWIKRFRLRHNIVPGKISGEAASVPEGVPDDWLKTVWPTIRRNYIDDQIFNADETGLFYKMTPDKTLKFKGEKCTRGKTAKDRIIVLVATNMTGSEKRKLVIIGKSKNPRCFKNVKSLPVVYKGNKKAWMTSEIFINVLRDWDKELLKAKKKIVLLVDNCPAHPQVENLCAIKLAFLPPNTTSVLQPIDQGIIKALKVQFRKLQVMKIIENADRNTTWNITLIEAITMISSAWDKVSSQTIANCFRHAGFLPLTINEGDDETTLLQTPKNSSDGECLEPSYDEDDEIPLAQWINKVSNVLPEEHLMDFVNVDCDLETWGDITDQEIVENISNNQEDSMDVSDDQENENDFQPPSILEAVHAADLIRKFVSFSGAENKVLMNNILNIEKSLEVMYYKSKVKQTKITDFFAIN